MDEILSTLHALQSLPEDELVGDWTHRIADLTEAAVEAARQDTGATAVVPVPAVRPGRRTRRWNWALAAGVAGIALGLGGGSLLFPSASEPAPSALSRPEGSGVLRATAADGVTAALQAENTGWGTRIVMDLSKVPGPQDCSLIAVSRDGTEQTAFTWHVPDHGYGLPASEKERLLAIGGVGTPTDQITEYTVRNADGKTLLKIPAGHPAA
ncbi:hypothetical protein [Streptomyces bauhiniae]